MTHSLSAQPSLGVRSRIYRSLYESQGFCSKQTLAARCSISYPWFAKRFHDYFGISCKQCIEKLRVETVEQYLTYSDLDLKTISQKTGYTDCSHMVKDFRRMNGMTPGQYRSLMKRQGRSPISPFEHNSPSKA